MGDGAGAGAGSGVAGGHMSPGAGAGAGVARGHLLLRGVLAEAVDRHAVLGSQV